MQVQKVRLSANHYSYIVLDNNYRPIQPILSFIRHLDHIDKSPNTLRAYANHLKLYWDYLAENAIDWSTVSLEQLSAFVGWLRHPKTETNVIALNESQTRKHSTINSILGSLASFYQYHHRLGNTQITLNDSMY